MAHNTSYDFNDEITTQTNIFPHRKPIHEVLGGGKVADVLLWRDRNVSAVLLFGMTAIWFLFEVAEYSFVTLLCHISITTMLVLYIWSKVADILKWNGPQIIETLLQDSYFQDLASIFHRRFNHLSRVLHYISCGTDLPQFFLIIVSLYIMSVIGSYFSFINLLYIGFLCIQTLPIVYDRYEEEINNVVGHIILDLRKIYRRFEKGYLKKIPRGAVKKKIS
ncbi:PREDICTED: reticulon-like protein B9 [Lupinus angustifolius]|uniref:reticulon-like protein B9 n=1 Tax=Lupinus angustifolius TaxID=3871 RepID=UPI00092F01F5|nr:PREDICTED: reticulon-like protein B9 [Lupinus angustifolius]